MAAAIGMSAAGQALGFGQTGVADPAAQETEEQRRKQLAAIRDSQAGIQDLVGAGYGAALSPVGGALFGGGY
jgi:hypothetical protein